MKGTSRRSRPIVLTTDFGLADGYVGVVKGVILTIAPDATLVDLTHGVAPQDVVGAAYVLGTSYRYFPPGSIHLVVVDPGVGSQRRAIALETPRATFVAPDNGVLSWVLRDLDREAGRADRGEDNAPRWPVPPEARAVELAEPRFWLPSPSATFHGRDVFGPIAAHLSRGVALDDLGPPVADLALLPAMGPTRGHGGVVGHVVRIDRFGNLITDLRPEDLPERPAIDVRGRRLVGLRRYYAESQGLGALVGSDGLVEIALTYGSAAAELGARAGDEVTVTSRPAG